MGRVHVSISSRIARIALSNPDKYNAMSFSMWQSLAQAVAELDENEEVRVLLLKGEGEKAFVSGADISEFDSLRTNADAVHAYDEAVDLAQSALVTCSKPVVASIRGVCMGGGIGLALACDLRYASRGSRFRMPAARMGLGYAYKGLRHLVDVLGPAATADVFYTARTFSGEEAERIGLVHRAYEDEEFDRQVEATLTQIAANAPLSMRAAKLGIRAASGCQDSSAEVDEAVRACFKSADYVEGRHAFMEKRPPEFNGS